MSRTTDIRVGALDRIITIRTYNETRNSLNQVIEGTPVDTEVYASVMEADPSKEVNLTDQITYRRVIKAVVRFRPTWRNVEGKIIYDGVEYDIRSTREMPGTSRRSYIVITAVMYE